MNKLLFLFIFIICSSRIFSQSTASAIISATVVTPVGAEISGDINFSSSAANSNAIFASYKNSADNASFSSNNKMAISYVKIIGGSFVYDVSLQTDPISLPDKNGNVAKINVFKMPVKMQTTDVANLPVVATLNNNFETKENYTSSFIITINFN